MHITDTRSYAGTFHLGEIIFGTDSHLWPTARPRRAQLNIAAARDLWSDIARSSHYSAIFRESLKAAEDVEPTQCILWLRDLTSMRAQVAQALHQGIVNRFHAEYFSQIAGADAELRHYLESLRALKIESDERFLVASREVALRLVGLSGLELVGR